MLLLAPRRGTKTFWFSTTKWYSFVHSMRLSASKGKSALLTLASIIFVAIGIWLMGREPLIGWVGTIFFGLCGIVCAVNLLPNASFLELDEEGFTCSTSFRKWSVRWIDVEEFKLIKINFNRMAGWNYVDGYKEMRKSRKLSSILGGAQAALPDTYGMDAIELVDLLEEWRLKSERSSNK